jgi:hypothetical protein
MVGESTEAVGAGVGGGSSGTKMPTLEEYGTNLTKLAEEVFLFFCHISLSCVIELVTTSHQCFSSSISTVIHFHFVVSVNCLALVISMGTTVTLIQRYNYK